MIKIKLPILIIITLVLFFGLAQLLPDVLVATNGFMDLIAVRADIFFDDTIYDKREEIDPDKTNIMIIMDDAWDSQYTIGFNLMNERDMVGSIAVITSVVNEPKYMSNANLLKVYNHGWDLLNHTNTHRNLSEIGYEKQKKEIKTAKNWLLRHGYSRGINSLIYPYGEHNDQTIDIMKDLDISYGRTIFSDFIDDKDIILDSINAFVILAEDPIYYVKALIDQALTDKKTLILVFHEFDKADNKYSYDSDKFVEVLDYIDEVRDEINLITYSQWFEYLESKIIPADKTKDFLA